MTPVEAGVIALLKTEGHVTSIGIVAVTDELNNDIGMDSLDQVDFCMAVEDEFKVEIPDHVIDEWTTVQSVITSVENAQV